MSFGLEMTGVSVRFRRFTLGPVTMRLDAGRIVGLVGPNGSGKTTTIRCVAGNLRYHSGAIRVCETPALAADGAWKQDIGYVPDEPLFYRWMTGRRFFLFLSRIYANWSEEKAAGLARRFQLDTEEKIRHMSAGARVKLSLTAALAHSPRLMLFDEPTVGLDPVVRQEVFDVLGELMESGEVTILYSTHIIDDIHRLADDVVFLSRGSIRLQQEKDKLIDNWREITYRCADINDIDEGVLVEDRRENVYQLLSENGEKTIAELKSRNADILSVRPLTLEEIAVRIMREE